MTVADRSRFPPLRLLDSTTKQDLAFFKPGAPVIDGAQRVGAQQLGGLLCIDPVVGTAFWEQGVATWIADYDLRHMRLEQE
jgi:hypothetical protein